MMLDHLVLATPDLAASVADFAERSGVAPAPGGSHTGLGTANALIGLGGDAYLEIVGPDLGQPEPTGPRPFGIDDLDRPTLLTWAIHPVDVDAAIQSARRAGYDPGPASAMSRRTPDGDELRWRLTRADGLVPFLIDWGTTPHPTTRGLPAVSLRTFTLTHPEPDRLRTRLAALRVTTPVVLGPVPGLTAVLDTPRGVIDI